MPESFGWPDGQIYLYTGNLATSAFVAYAQNISIAPSWGWDSRVAASGNYNDHLTGKRMNISIQAIYTVDTTLLRMADSATAVHMKLLHQNIIGSAGYWFYSGHIDSAPITGAEGNPFTFSLQAHANIWSAF